MATSQERIESLLKSELESDEESTSKGSESVDLSAVDDDEDRSIERLKKKQRMDTQRKIRAINLEGKKLKEKREKESSGEEKATNEYDLLAQYRQREKEFSGKEKATDGYDLLAQYRQRDAQQR